MLTCAGVDVAALRRREFSRLDASGTAYLDYAGAALYPASLVRREARHLMRSVLGNPHSENAPSLASTASLDAARAMTLRFFDANPAEYDVVFTANASGAVRILAEAFPFRAGSRLVLTSDNHNSVNGLRLSAERGEGTVHYVPLKEHLRAPDVEPWLPRTQQPSLFAFPAQSNFSGVRHPLHWVTGARTRGYHVLLDAAAYVPSNPLSLREVAADFVAISFYKMFGYPTGVGALIARHHALAALRRSYFAGGAVRFVSVQNQDLFGWREGGTGFEDGTPNFLAMQAVCNGLEWMDRVGMSSIQQHVARLTSSLLRRFESFGPRVRVYGPADSVQRGGVIAFNLCSNGRVLDYEQVETAARVRGIAIRGGCFCNPGAAEQAFGFTPERARECFDDEFSIARLRACMPGHAVGALRASIGVATTEGDLDRLIELVSELTA